MQYEPINKELNGTNLALLLSLFSSGEEKLSSTVPLMIIFKPFGD